MSVMTRLEAGERTPEETLRWAFATFSRVAIVASLQAESSVIIDMATRIRNRVNIVTLDTGRLPAETHDMMRRITDRYSVPIEVVKPDPADIHDLVLEHGTNPFYSSPDLRRLCCEIRKSRPLERALRGYDAWVTGVRRGQMPTRAETKIVSIDPRHPGLTKLAPLAAWSKQQVWNYIHTHDVPYHALYDSGYTSIGCAPCTRATSPGEDERAGRWWWEKDEVKECGLHWTPDNRPVPGSS